MNAGHAEVVWSEDFNDGDYDGWSLNLGEVTAENQTFRNLEGSTILCHESNITVGTWSFDAFISISPHEVFNVWFMSDNKFTVIPPEGWNGSAYCITVYTPPDAPHTPYVDGTKIHLRKIHGAYGDPLAMDSLAEYIAPDDLSMTWHHIDITRDESGIMTVYLDYEPIIEYTDTTINASRYFQLYTIVKNVKFDNIIVKDVVDPPQIQEWDDDFDDGDYEGWTVRFGSWSITNYTLQALYHSDTIDNGGYIQYPSDIAYGTWSFDVYLRPTKMVLFPFIIINGTWVEYGYDYWLEIKPWRGITEFIFSKDIGTYPEFTFPLDYYAILADLTDRWHHIDITRDIEGRFYIYLNGDLIMDALDDSVKTSETFRVFSYPDGSLIDNISVRNIVDILPPIPADVSVEISREEIIQGEELLITVQVKDDYGDPILGLSVDVILEESMVDVSRISWGVHQAVVDTSEYLGTVEFVVTVERAGFILSESTHHIEVVAPASFVTGNLSIEPNIVDWGKQVAVTVEVTNVGGQEGSYQLLVDIEGVTREDITVTLDPGASKTVFLEFLATESGTFTVDVDGLSGSFTVVEPASFELSNLIIDPTSVKVGESISISVDCRNTGGISGSYDVTLEIDGEIEDTSSVTLDAGESTSVSFDVSATQEGTYSVEIGGLTGSYTVERQQRGIPGFPIESIILGLAIVLLAQWLYHRRS